jgi:hypothetical protein
MKRTPILASLANAMLLLVASGAIIYEAVQRFSTPAPVAEMTVIMGRADRHRDQRAPRRSASCRDARTTSTSAAPSCTWWADAVVSRASC